MGDMKESIQKYIDERLSSPLWGYLLVSMLTYNWKPLSVLFFSKDKIQDRITAIQITADYAWSLWAPLCVGVGLAVFSPYIHRGLCVLHDGAEKWKEKSANKLKIREYKNEKQLVKERVQLANAELLEEERQKTKRSLQEARTKKIDLRIESLRKERDELLDEVNTFQMGLDALLAKESYLKSDIDELSTRCLKVMSLIDELNSLSSSKDVSAFKSRIKLIFNDDELSRARKIYREKNLGIINNSSLKKNEELFIIGKKNFHNQEVNNSKLSTEVFESDVEKK